MGEAAFVEDEKNRRAARREVKKVIEAVHHAIPVSSPETRLERRKEVIPNRECAQPIVTLPAELPAAVVEAERFARAARDFRFDAVSAPVPVVIATPALEPTDDTEFQFFRGN
jgi:hypothetical protein